MNAIKVLELFAPYTGWLVWVAIVLIAFDLAIYLRTMGTSSESVSEKPKYTYGRKQFFMTRAEHQFYKGLVEAVGANYFIFAQVHLTDIVSYEITGQNWHVARAHIDRKSVDYLLCDKEYLSPRLAIELDDSSHERADRVIRDGEVERILEMAGLPLLRVHYSENISSMELSQRIKLKLVA